MNLTRDRMRSIGWAAILLGCLAFTVVLTFKVNAVKSQVRLAERQILSVKQDKMLLETESGVTVPGPSLLQGLPTRIY